MTTFAKLFKTFKKHKFVFISEIIRAKHMEKLGNFSIILNIWPFLQKKTYLRNSMNIPKWIKSNNKKMTMGIHKPVKAKFYIRYMDELAPE